MASQYNGFSAQFGVPDFPTLSVENHEFVWSHDQASAVKYQPEMSHEFGEECNGLVSNIWPLYPMANSENWGSQTKLAGQIIEEQTVKVAKYSQEERKERILKYLKKRNQRNFNKTIKYACRKTLADRRVRVRGRFAKNNESTSEDETPIKANDSSSEPNNLYYDGSLQMTPHDEEWLHEAIANLMYIPYVEY